MRIEMPLKVTKNFIHVPSGEPDSGFQKEFGRVITIDKSRGIKATIRRLKGSGKTRVSSYMFPTNKFTKAQAQAWVKAHKEEATDMETTNDLQATTEAVWTAAFVNDLPDSSFLYVGQGGSKDSDGKTKPRSLRKFPYKDKSGKVDLPHLRNALARIPQSSLSPALRKSVAAKARGIAKKQGIEVSEEFLDPVNMRWPLTYPAIFETLIAFNNGELFEDCGEYYWDRVSTYGRKLARKLTQMTNNRTISDEYDEDGNPTSALTVSDNESKTMYKFHDGQVITVRSTSSGESGMEWEYSEDEEEPEMTFAGEETDDDLFEAEYPGQVIKSLRNRKKMSRKEMATVMAMSMTRLAEIEDGDDPDDDEVGEIAGALGMTKKRLKKAIAIPPEKTQVSGREENEGDEEAFVEITDENENDVIEIENESGEEIEILAAEEKDDAIAVFESVGLYEIDGKEVTSHRLSGGIVMEETRSDGTCRFVVPMIKIDAYTANGNRYSQTCAETLVRDINRLHESQRDTPVERRSCLDIRIPPKAGQPAMEEKFDMMPTHGPRINSAYGNPLLSKAGKIVGGYVDYEQKIAYVLGETIRTQAGKDMTVLLEEEMVKGVSLVAIPKTYESNGKGPDKKGLDVDRFEFKGADFTENPAMPFPEFADKETYFELVKQ